MMTVLTKRRKKKCFAFMILFWMLFVFVSTNVVDVVASSVVVVVDEGTSFNVTCPQSSKKIAAVLTKAA
jgi:hypothetical protein